MPFLFPGNHEMGNQMSGIIKWHMIQHGAALYYPCRKTRMGVLL